LEAERKGTRRDGRTALTGDRGEQRRAREPNA
jgi:hypothetical protein